MARGGCCGNGLFCLGSLSRKNKKRIVPATRLHDGTAQPSDPQGQFAFLLAPPSSPASYQNSMVPSSVQSPYYPPVCPNPPGSGSRIPLETQSNMFAVGPYAHETALVSPPVFSTFTTAPSTAPFTPPPELAAQFTTPSSPDVPFAKLLASSLNEQRSTKREQEVQHSASPFASPDYYHTQQDDLQVAYQLYPGSPLGRLISPAGDTGASTPFAAGGTTGTTTPYPEAADNPTPLTVLPAVVSTLPNLEHHLAESLHQRSILDSQCGPGDPMNDSGRERDGSFSGHMRYHGSLVQDRNGGPDPHSNSYGNERYSGSLSGLNEVLEGRNGFSKMTKEKSLRYSKLKNEENEMEDDMRDEDLLEIPMLLSSKKSQHDSRASMPPSHGSKAGSGSDALKDWDPILEYACSLLEGTGSNGRGVIGWGPVDTSLSRESESSGGVEALTDDSDGNTFRVNPLDKNVQEEKGGSDGSQETAAVESVAEPQGKQHHESGHETGDPGKDHPVRVCCFTLNTNPSLGSFSEAPSHSVINRSLVFFWVIERIRVHFTAGN
jgi:hypothetical protein